MKGRLDGPECADGCPRALKGRIMIHPFEDHCWKDIVPADVLELYKHYHRDTYVGERAALVAIDLYEMAYQGGNKPVAEVSKTYPSSCGKYAWNAIPPTQRVFAAARAA